jgi:FixJ family two-component response regulator
MSTKTQQIPVVVVTGASDPDMERIARELGAVEFLHKPVDPGELHAILARLLPMGDASTAR